MMFSINSTKHKLIAGVGAIAFVWTLMFIGYLNWTPHNYGPRLISVDIYADDGGEGLAFYEALPDDECVVVKNEHRLKADTKKTVEISKVNPAFDTSMIYASSPKCKIATPFPQGYQQLGSGGFVGLVLNINTEGKIERGEIDKTSGFKALDDAALKQVTETWRFEPCKKADKAVACRQTIKFRWKSDVK